MSGGGGGGGGSENSTQTVITQPWSGAKPYLVGNKKKGIPGIFPEAQNYFEKFKTLNPEQQGLNTSYSDILKGRQSGDVNAMRDVSNKFLTGGYDPNVLPANLSEGFRDLGAVDPTQALSKSLSGKIDNPYLEGLHQANINTSLRGYGDAVRDFTTQVLPNIGDQAFAAGGYGGSRHGIAEGLGMEQLLRNARDLGISAMDAGTNLYGGAYENAQGRMANTGQFLAGMGGQNEQFNANLAMQNEQAAAQNATQGLSSLQNTFGISDNIYNQLQSILAAPQGQFGNALNQYANIVAPGAAMGGSTTTTTSIPTYGGGGSSWLGGALGLGGLLGSFL